jgi:nicotinate-nucleotide adenylyltransferase
MAKTLLFGGCFDPPHLGHMKLLENAIGAVRPDRVLVIPAGLPPHKHPGAAPGALRLAMCRCFCPLHSALEVSGLEVERPGKSYTWDTLAALRAEAPADDFYLTVGGDMLRGFAEWRYWRRLLEAATLVAGGRGEDGGLQAAAEALRREGGRVVWAEGPVVPVASSAVRAAIAAGGIRAEREGYVFVPPPADAIVRAHRLYTAM